MDRAGWRQERLLHIQKSAHTEILLQSVTLQVHGGSWLTLVYVENVY